MVPSAATGKLPIIGSDSTFELHGAEEWQAWFEEVANQTEKPAGTYKVETAHFISRLLISVNKFHRFFRLR
jgi:hypothetical protein